MVMASNSSGAHHEGKRVKLGKDVKLLTIPPKDLSIVWGREKRYWNVPGHDQEWDKCVADHEKCVSEGATAAELYQVCWLEVTGVVEEADPEKSYEIRIELCLTPDAFGWGASHPVYLMAKRGESGKFIWKTTTLELDKPNVIKTYSVLAPPTNKPKDNTNNDNDKQNMIHFGLYEVWSGKWKGGLKIFNVSLCQC